MCRRFDPAPDHLKSPLFQGAFFISCGQLIYDTLAPDGKYEKCHNEVGQGKRPPRCCTIRRPNNGRRVLRQSRQRILRYLWLYFAFQIRIRHCTGNDMDWQSANWNPHRKSDCGEKVQGDVGISRRHRTPFCGSLEIGLSDGDRYGFVINVAA